jgi:hypothetical protein
MYQENNYVSISNIDKLMKVSKEQEKLTLCLELTVWESMLTSELILFQI